MISGHDPLRMEAVAWRMSAYLEECHPRWNEGEGLRSRVRVPRPIPGPAANARRNSHCVTTCTLTDAS
jgi:hypothetical protein